MGGDLRWRRAVTSSDLSCSAKLLAVVVADSSETDTFRFDAVAAGAVLDLSVATVRAHWKAVAEAGFVQVVGNDAGEAVYAAQLPWSGDGPAEPGVLVLRSPAAVAVTSRGRVQVAADSAAQQMLNDWFAWARSVGRPPVQPPLQVRQVLSTVLANGADRDDVARALARITETDETVTARSMMRALAWVRDGGRVQMFRSDDDQQWAERNVQRAKALDAQNRSAW